MTSLRSIRRRLCLAVLAGAAACAGSGGAPRTRPTRFADRITATDIERGRWQNAYEMVSALRPRWLSTRGRDSILGETTDVQVYLDDVRVGGTVQLRAISVEDIDHMQFFGPTEAGARWGTGHGNGVIYIVTRR